MTGLPTVLLPGTLCDAALWDGVAVPGGARLLHSVRGGSLAEAAGRVLEAVPGERPFHLLGFSLGAIVAFEVLRLAPGRLAQLTLVSANPHLPTQGQLDGWAQHTERVRAGGFEALVETLGGSPHAQTLRDMARRVGPDVYLEQLNLLRSRPDSRPDLARFSGPLTVLVGQDDGVTPPRLADELGALAPQAEVIRVPGAGHYLPLDAPNSLSAVLAGPALMGNVLTGVAHA